MLLWLEEGKLRGGLLHHFLEVRGKNWPRLNSRELAESKGSAISGFLTASALLRIAAALPGERRRIIVTAGMGGIRGGNISVDLHELLYSPDLLLASAFKDSQELETSLDFLRERGVRLLGWQCERLDGFLFREDSHALDSSLKTEKEAQQLFSREDGKSIVFFNPLPPSVRIKEREMLAEAIKRGEEAHRAGVDFHPVVNEALDRASSGRASLLQLLALIANILLAFRLNAEWEEI